VVAPEDFEPQVDPEAPNGSSQDAAAPQAPDAEAPAPAAEAPSPETPAEAAPAAADDAPAGEDETTGPIAALTPAATGPGEPTTDGPALGAPDGEPVAEPVTPATTSEDSGAEAPADAGEQAPDAAPASDGAPAAEGEQPADGAPAEGESGGAAQTAEGGEPKKKRRRSRGKRSGRGGGASGGPGGKRRFAWDEVFLRQRLELLRAMDPDPAAITWAVDTAGRFEVADILAGEGSSGREFGRRAYGATPETEDQAAWIVLAAVRARDIVSIARRAVSGTQDQREQVKAAIELLGIARVNTALQGDRPAQQVYAERARRVDVTVGNGEDQKAAWALLSLARPQDVVSAATPRRPAGGPGGPGRGGPGGPGGPGRGGPGGFDRGGRRERREPPIPGGVFSVGESGIGGELGAKLRAALAAAEGTPAEPETPAEPATPEPAAPVSEAPEAATPETEAPPASEAPEAETPAPSESAGEESASDAPAEAAAADDDAAPESQDS